MPVYPQVEESYYKKVNVAESCSAITSGGNGNMENAIFGVSEE